MSDDCCKYEIERLTIDPYSRAALRTAIFARCEMVLFRGRRHANGRADVLVYGPLAELWLHKAADRHMPAGQQYAWGEEGKWTTALAYDLLLVTFGDALVAELLCDELADQWLLMLPTDYWSYADFEIRRWAMSELVNEISRHRESPGKGGVPCPSEN